MADSHGPSPRALELLREFEARPWAIDFYEALRRLEAAFPDRPRLGESVRPSDDPVRLGQEPSLAFAPTTLASAKAAGPNGVANLLVYFLGVFGPNGPLPLHLTEYARERMRTFRDPTMARFADVFHHRFLSLFYRAWANAQPTVSLDRPSDDRFADYVGALCGYGADSLHARDRLPDATRLFFAGRLAVQSRSAEGLEAMVCAYLDVPADVIPFVGDWLDLPEDSYWRLGAAPFGALGQSATLGARVWDCQHKFRIDIGPLGLKRYRDLLPGSDGLQRLVSLVRTYLGDELEWDVRLLLDAREVPSFQLGATGQLGWTTWLGQAAMLGRPAGAATGRAHWVGNTAERERTVEAATFSPQSGALARVGVDAA